MSRKKNKFPAGWDEKRVRKVLRHYEGQAEAEAVREDEAAFKQPSTTVFKVPRKLVSAVRKLIAAHQH